MRPLLRYLHIACAATVIWGVGCAVGAPTGQARAAFEPRLLVATHCLQPGNVLSILGSHFGPGSYTLFTFDHVALHHHRTGRRVETTAVIEPWWPNGAGYFFPKRPDAEGYFEQNVRFLGKGELKAPLGTTHVHVWGFDPRQNIYTEVTANGPLTVDIERSCPPTVPLTVGVTYVNPVRPPYMALSVNSAPRAALVVRLAVGNRELAPIRATADGRGYLHRLIPIGAALPIDAVAVVRASVGRSRAVAFALTPLSQSG